MLIDVHPLIGSIVADVTKKVVKVNLEELLKS